MIKVKNLCHSNVIAFSHGIFISLLIVLLIQAQYEDSLFDQIVQQSTHPSQSASEQLQALLETAHSLVENRFELFKGQPYLWRDKLLRSGDSNLQDGKGACGSYTHVLGRILQQADYPIRIAQMKCSREGWGCHILLEVYAQEKWIVMDAMFNLMFKTPQGAFGSFRQVRDNWEYYKQQLPAGYYEGFDYQDVRHTNWDKIPVIMPTIKYGLDIILGKDIADGISLRTYALNVYRVYFILLAMLYTLLVVLTVYCRRK